MWVCIYLFRQNSETKTFLLSYGQNTQDTDAIHVNISRRTVVANVSLIQTAMIAERFMQNQSNSYTVNHKGLKAVSIRNHLRLKSLGLSPHGHLTFTTVTLSASGMPGFTHQGTQRQTCTLNCWLTPILHPQPMFLQVSKSDIGPIFKMVENETPMSHYG